MASQQIDTDTHVAFKRHHVRRFAFALVVAIVAIGGFAYYYGGNVSVKNGQLVVTAPDLSSLKDRIIVKTPEGQVVAQVQQSPQPVPNGQVKTTVDGFDSDHRFQRTETDETRYDPIDRLNKKIDATSDATNKSISKLAEQIGGFGTKIGARFDDVESKISGVDKKVNGAIDRIGTLEQKTAQQQPAPAQPAPQPAAPTPAPAPTSQAAPVQPAPGPQASLPAPAQVADNSRIVTLSTASQRELSEMYATGKALGKDSQGRKVSGFQELKRDESFVCPNGNRPRLLAGVHIPGRGTAQRWDCSGR